MKKLFILLCGVVVLAACSNRPESLFDASLVEEEAKKNFPVQNVDPNHTWSMMEVRKLDVTINGSSGESYTVRLYTDNPINTGSNAALLAKSTVKNGEKVTLSFDAPSVMRYIYVLKEDKEFNRSMKIVDISTEKAVTFGLEKRSERSVGARSSVVNYTVPDVTDTSLFPTSIPVGIAEFNPNNYVAKNAYKVTSATKVIDLGNQSDITLYIAENVELSRLYLTSGSKCLVLPNVEVKVAGNFELGQNLSTVSVGKGASFSVSDMLQLSNNNTQFYNLGDLNASSVEIAGNGTLYNAGKIKTKKIAGSNQTSKIINAGTLDTGSLSTAGSSDFVNEAEGIVTVSGATTINSNSNGWENNGVYTTGTMEISAVSTRLQNNCKLVIHGEFKMATAAGATFSNNGGAYTECASAYLDNAILMLGTGAFFKVDGTAALKYGNRIQGIGNDRALFMVAEATQPSGHMWSVTYSGNLFVACDNHFAPDQDEWNIASEYKLEGAAEVVGISNTNIDIPSSTCNPGVSNQPNNDPIPDVSADFTYVFEDITTEAGDFDYNDVVLRVSNPVDGKITVTLVAAGAANDLKVAYNFGSVNGQLFLGKEVHAVFGKPSGTLINTNAGVTANSVSEKVSVPAGFSLTNDGDIYILDHLGIEVHIPGFGTQRSRPYGLRIPGNWAFPPEREKITVKYPKFTEWAENQSNSQDWYIK